LLAAFVANLAVPAVALVGAPANAVLKPFPPVSAAVSTASAAESVPGEVLVGYVPGVSAGARDQARGRADARLVDKVVTGQANRPQVELLRLPKGGRVKASLQLASDPAVAYVEPNWIYTDQVTSSDPYFTNGSLWGMYGARTNPANRYGSHAAAAWAAGKTGPQRCT